MLDTHAIARALTAADFTPRPSRRHLTDAAALELRLVKWIVGTGLAGAGLVDRDELVEMLGANRPRGRGAGGRGAASARLSGFPAPAVVAGQDARHPRRRPRADRGGELLAERNGFLTRRPMML